MLSDVPRHHRKHPKSPKCHTVHRKIPRYSKTFRKKFCAFYKLTLGRFCVGGFFVGGFSRWIHAEFCLSCLASALKHQPTRIFDEHAWTLWFRVRVLELLFGVGSSALLAHRDSGLGFGGAQTSGLEVSGILSEKGSELRWRIGHWS